MSTSLIYRNSRIYETLMQVLYGRGYDARYREIAELIPEGSTLLDLCCGPATLFHRYLKMKNVRYTGLDINPAFIRELRQKGGHGEIYDMRDEKPFPEADCVLMQASLYHFLPDPYPVVLRMLAACRKRVIIAEPVRNLTDSSIPVIAWLSGRMTDPGTGTQAGRFNETRLDRFFEHEMLKSHVVEARLIAEGREKLYILAP